VTSTTDAPPETCAQWVPPPEACESTGPSLYEVTIEPLSAVPDDGTPVACTVADAVDIAPAGQVFALDCGMGDPVPLAVNFVEPAILVPLSIGQRVEVSFYEYYTSMESPVEHVLTVRDELGDLVLGEAAVSDVENLDFAPLQLSQVPTACSTRSGGGACLEGGDILVQNQRVRAAWGDQVVDVFQGNTAFVGVFTSYAISVAQSEGVACWDEDCATGGPLNFVSLAVVVIPEG
jgi:hypothetical protein